MTDTFAIQHRGTGGYLKTCPSETGRYILAQTPAEAHHWSSFFAAEKERNGLDSFADSFEVVPLPDMEHAP